MPHHHDPRSSRPLYISLRRTKHGDSGTRELGGESCLLRAAWNVKRGTWNVECGALVLVTGGGVFEACVAVFGLRVVESARRGRQRSAFAGSSNVACLSMHRHSGTQACYIEVHIQRKPDTRGSPSSIGSHVRFFPGHGARPVKAEPSSRSSRDGGAAGTTSFQQQALDMRRAWGFLSIWLVVLHAPTRTITHVTYICARPAKRNIHLKS